jgi:hypothetical protein
MRLFRLARCWGGAVAPILALAVASAASAKVVKVTPGQSI